MVIFDSLGHASVNGKWLKSNLDASFKTYSEELVRNSYIGGMVVGLAGQNDYSHESFIEISNKYKNLFPIAGFDPLKELPDSLSLIKNLGFYGIKIHPRFSGIDLRNDQDKLIACFQACAELDMPIFLCSYFNCSLERMPSYDPFYELLGILKRCVDTKIIIVHGGGIDLMRYAELARFNENLLLDLSLVMMKYQNSSIDSDIKFLMQSFDRRITIGSDFPEYSLSDIKERFDYLSEGIAIEKKENIGFKNILNFLEISF